MLSAALHSFLLALLLLGSALTAVKLFVTGLHKKYPVFFLYLVFRVPNSLWPLLLDSSSNTYFYFYLGALPLVLLFYVLLVRELYHLVLEDYRGLQTAGRWAMYISLAGAIAISIITLLPKIQPSMPQRSKAIGVVLAFERGTDTAMAVFIILLLALVSRYPIRLRRNVRVHAFVFSVFFLSGTMGLLVRAVLGMRSLNTLNTVTTALNVVCVLAWLVLLNPAGEEVQAAKVGARDDHEQRLLLQLQGLNTALLRVARR